MTYIDEVKQAHNDTPESIAARARAIQAEVEARRAVRHSGTVAMTYNSVQDTVYNDYGAYNMYSG